MESSWAELLELMALCGALTVNALPTTGATFDANALANAVGLDMADLCAQRMGGMRCAPVPALHG